MADEQTPHPRQQAVIDAVCGLANALLGSWGRGAGQSWTRRAIAARIVADDDYVPHADLSHLSHLYTEGGDDRG